MSAVAAREMPTVKGEVNILDDIRMRRLRSISTKAALTRDPKQMLSTYWHANIYLHMEVRRLLRSKIQNIR